MRKHILVLFLFISWSFCSTAQIHFEKGYFISNTKDTNYCFIKNVEWTKNPSSLEYKFSLDELETKIMTIDSVQEFRVLGYDRFISAKLEIDMSSSFTNRLSDSENPEWETRTVFLRALVEGKASLYYYGDGEINRFFYTVDTTPLQQLIYKEYNVNQLITKKNNEFKKQIWLNLMYENTSVEDIERLRYRKEDLMNYFEKFNNFFTPNSTTKLLKKQQKIWNLKIVPGLNSSTILTRNTYGNLYEELSSISKTNFRMGVEFEYVFPVNRNKWSFLLEPSYEKISSDIGFGMYGKDGRVTFGSIELDLGIRHYLFITDDTKFFVNLLVARKFNQGSSASYKATNFAQDRFDKYTTSHFAANFGIGLTSNRVGFELRFKSLKENFAGFYLETLRYAQINLLFQYTFLKSK